MKFLSTATAAPHIGLRLKLHGISRTHLFVLVLSIVSFDIDPTSPFAGRCYYFHFIRWPSIERENYEKSAEKI